jgi:hypothetical protein
MNTEVEAMDNTARSEALRRALFTDATSRVYGVLDGASIPGLLSFLAEHDVDNVCLFRGELDPELAQTAPYLVHLPPESPFTQRLLRQGWGHHWGILAVSEVELRVLRLHFRKFIMVWDPDGKPLYFRYYDPRVLRVYLPTCNTDELRTVFGPVKAYVMEGETSDVVLRFALAEGVLAREELALPSIASP